MSSTSDSSALNNELLQRLLASVQAVAADVQFVKEEVATIKTQIRQGNFESSNLIRRQLKGTHEKLVDDMVLVGEVMRRDLKDVHKRIDQIDQRLGDVAKLTRNSVSQRTQQVQLKESNQSQTSQHRIASIEELNITAQQQKRAPIPISPPVMADSTHSNSQRRQASNLEPTIDYHNATLYSKNKGRDNTTQGRLRTDDLAVSNNHGKKDQNFHEESMEQDWAAVAALSLRSALHENGSDRWTRDCSPAVLFFLISYQGAVFAIIGVLQSILFASKYLL